MNPVGLSSRIALNGKNIGKNARLWLDIIRFFPHNLRKLLYS